MPSNHNRPFKEAINYFEREIINKQLKLLGDKGLSKTYILVDMLKRFEVSQKKIKEIFSLYLEMGYIREDAEKIYFV